MLRSTFCLGLVVRQQHDFLGFDAGGTNAGRTNQKL
jgi:hypothetical protein